MPLSTIVHTQVMQPDTTEHSWVQSCTHRWCSRTLLNTPEYNHAHTGAVAGHVTSKIMHHVSDEFPFHVRNILLSRLDSSSAVQSFFIQQSFEFITHYCKLTPKCWRYCRRLCIKNKLIIYDRLLCPCFVITTASSYKSKQKIAAVEVILESV